MRQITFATAGFERYAKTTRRAAFLAEMDQVVPWARLCALIAPYYPKPGMAVRRFRWSGCCGFTSCSIGSICPTRPRRRALYESPALRAFAGIDLGAAPAPDETTILRFRHLLEAHDLSARIFEDVLAHLEAKGMKIAAGTIVDATIIHAPSSTKNKDQARDPEMHQTKKGNQWYFGMKAHLGVDSKSKLIHAAAATPANVHDGEVLGDLLHGEETRVWGDQAYRGKTDIIREHAPCAQDFTNRRHRHHGVVDEAERAKNRTKSKVRSKVEHPIGVIKRIFGFAKVRYRGVAKNAHRLFVAAALANLFMARRRLLRLATA